MESQRKIKSETNMYGSISKSSTSDEEDHREKAEVVGTREEEAKRACVGLKVEVVTDGT